MHCGTSDSSCLPSLSVILTACTIVYALGAYCMAQIWQVFMIHHEMLVGGSDKLAIVFI
jgi:hypothetical protein